MSVTKYNNEVILYRLDAIERRLDNVEKHLHSSKENPDLIKILLELIKNGSPAQNAVIVDALVPPQQTAKAQTPFKTTTSDAVQLQPTDTFDTLACMARRRTVV